MSIINKIQAILYLSCLFFISCKENRSAITYNTSSQYIALQPIENYNTQRLNFIKKDLQDFFHKRVIILPSIELPASYLNTEKGKRYNADSIIHLLRSFKNDSIIDVAGLTYEDIYTTKRDEYGNIKQPVSTYTVWGVFGLGYQPGSSCIISDRRLQTNDTNIFEHRLRTVIIHEIGHNLGLTHCPTSGCIMSDANEKISTVDNSGNDYCSKCKTFLKL